MNFQTTFLIIMNVRSYNNFIKVTEENCKGFITIESSNNLHEFT